MSQEESQTRFTPNKMVRLGQAPKCSDCGAELLVEGPKCPDCANIVACSECEQKTTRDNATAVGGDWFCPDCAEECLAACSACGETTRKEDMQLAGLHRYCETCYDELYGECVSCGSPIRRDLIIRNHLGEGYCSDCYGELYGTCDNCGEEIDREDVRTDSDGEGTLCPDCADSEEEEEDDDGDGIVHDHDYKPFTRFMAAKKEGLATGIDSDDPTRNLYFGFELEIENIRRNIRNGEAADELPDWLYAKNDGSLKCGFEIVSCPMTWNCIKEHKEALEALCRKMTKCGFASYDTETCGMHVHFSKNAVTSYHLYKLLKFFYDNPEFILRVSQRRSRSALAQWASIEPDTDSIVYKAKTKRTRAKYLAVNLPNGPTVEIRIFRGSLNPKTVFKNLEFCHAAIMFSRANGARAMTPEEFQEYVEAHRKEYPNLLAFLTDLFSVCHKE